MSLVMNGMRYFYHTFENVLIWKLWRWLSRYESLFLKHEGLDSNPQFSWKKLGYLRVSVTLAVRDEDRRLESLLARDYSKLPVH